MRTAICFFVFSLFCLFGFSSPVEQNPILFDWKWENPRPQGNTLEAADMLPSGIGWMVGEVGTILFFNGMEWELQSSTVSEDLENVVAISEDDVWAVGADGVILHYNGIWWQKVSSSTSKDLYHLSASGADNVWAAGEDGTVLYCDGVKWQEVASPTSEFVWSIAAVDSSSVWIHADDRFWLYNVLSAQWTTYPTSLYAATDMYVASPESIWATGLQYGKSSSTELAVAHFDGESWENPIVLDFGSSYASYIDGSGENDIHVVYDNEIFSYDGYGWAQKLVPAEYDFQFLSVASSDYNSFVVGGEDGGILWYQNSSWSRFDKNSNQTGMLSGIFALDSEHVWAVGQGEQIMTYRAETDSWTSDIVSGMSTMYDVHASSKDNVWAVNPFNGTVAYNFGSGWHTVGIGGDNISFKGIRVLGEDDVWFVGYNDGNNGIIYHYDGAGFQQVESSTLPRFYDLDNAPGTNHLYAGAYDGRIFWYDGLVWSEFSKPPVNGKITKIAVRDDNDIWATAYYSSSQTLIIHYFFGQWEVLDDIPMEAMSITGLDVGETRVFVITDEGSSPLFVYENGIWQEFEEFDNFGGISVVSDSEFLIAGPWNDGILRGEEKTAPEIEVSPLEIFESYFLLKKPDFRSCSFRTISIPNQNNFSPPKIFEKKLRIENFGNAELEYAVETETDIDWLNAKKISGTVPVGGVEEISFFIHAQNLKTGFHQTKINISSNDVDEGMKEIPVFVEVK